MDELAEIQTVEWAESIAEWVAEFITESKKLLKPWVKNSVKTQATKTSACNSARNPSHGTGCVKIIWFWNTLYSFTFPSFVMVAAFSVPYSNKREWERTNNDFYRRSLLRENYLMRGYFSNQFCNLEWALFYSGIFWRSDKVSAHFLSQGSQESRENAMSFPWLV